MSYERESDETKPYPRSPHIRSHFSYLLSQFLFSLTVNHETFTLRVSLSHGRGPSCASRPPPRSDRNQTRQISAVRAPPFALLRSPLFLHDRLARHRSQDNEWCATAKCFPCLDHTRVTEK